MNKLLRILLIIWVYFILINEIKELEGLFLDPI